MTAERSVERCRRVGAALAEHGVEGLLVTHLPNIRYLTGFSGSAGVALVTGEDTHLLTDFRYREQAEGEVGGSTRVRIVERNPWVEAVAMIRKLELGRVGFEAAHVSVERVGTPGTGHRPELVPLSGIVEGFRVVKDPDEVESIRQAACLGIEALEATLPQIRPGCRENHIAATLEGELRRRGSEWHPFPTIVASGPRSALPHAGTSDRPVGVGEWLLLDFGVQVDGYCADITRTVVVGARADERQRAIYDLVREAQLRAIRHLRIGMTGRDADALARSVIAEKGFADAFGHSLGHGLGLEVHEEPRLARTSSDPLPDGAVVTVEPGIYLPGWGGVRIEDDVHLTAGGARLLTDGRTVLRELV